MQADRYNQLKELCARLPKNNEYTLTDEERTVITLRGITAGRFITEKLIERMKTYRSPSEDKKP